MTISILTYTCNKCTQPLTIINTVFYVGVYRNHSVCPNVLYAQLLLKGWIGFDEVSSSRKLENTVWSSRKLENTVSRARKLENTVWRARKLENTVSRLNKNEKTLSMTRKLENTVSWLTKN